jgi:hypothetical protein
LERCREGGRQVNGVPGILLQKSAETAGMIAMEVRKKNCLNLFRINPHFSHIAQQDIAIGAGIEKDNLRHSLDYARKSPGAFKLLGISYIVKDDPNFNKRWFALPGVAK